MDEKIKKKKHNKKIKKGVLEQLGHFFVSIMKQPNSTSIAQNMFDNIKKTHDVYEKNDNDNSNDCDNEILTGVGSLYKLVDLRGMGDFQYWNSYDDIIFEHELECELCKNGYNDDCEEYNEITLGDIECPYCEFTDGEFVVDREKEIVTVINDTLTFHVNYDSGIYLVFKSPRIVKRGMASLCYVGMADLDSHGEYKCYELPEEYFL